MNGPLSRPLDLARADGGRPTSDLFARIVCGVDVSEAGRVAARLAVRLAGPSGELVLVSVHDPRLAVHRGEASNDLVAHFRRRGTVGTAARVETLMVEGDPLDCLLAEVGRRQATLAVVGSHGQSRAVGIALGSVATHVLHEAPCSVLVARRPREDSWPRSIVAAIDGSPSSAEAAAAARWLADRVGSALRFVVAAREPFVDLDAAYRIAPELEELSGPVVHELHVISEDVISLSSAAAASAVSARSGVSASGSPTRHAAQCLPFALEPSGEPQASTIATLPSTASDMSGRRPRA